MFLLHILFALDGVLAGPVAQKQHVEKRQDTFGVIPGVPAGLSGMIMPLISSTGLLPTIVKTGINSKSCDKEETNNDRFSPANSLIARRLWKGCRCPRRCAEESCHAKQESTHCRF